MAMTLRLDEEQNDALDALAQLDGISKQEAALRAILETYGRRVHQASVSTASEWHRKRYAEVLESLGQ